MGQLLSRVRKKQSTLDVLEELDKEIETLEEYRRTTEQKRKRFVGTLVFYSVLLYIITAVISYFYWTDDDTGSKVLRIIPLVFFPFLAWGLKLLFQWLFRRRIESNMERLTEVLRKKKSILNEVKETETYKKAKEILEKFDPEFKKQQEKEKEAALNVQRSLTQSNSNLRQRNLQTPIQRGNNVHRFSPPKQSNYLSTSQVVPSAGFSMNGQWPRPSGPPLPRPILPREPGVFDRMVDFLVGDGPSNRYALICQRCLSHNGMALKEEFEYLAFRCCYCYTPNPARKIRPHAPRLPEASSQLRLLEATSIKSNDSSLDTTTEKETNESTQEEEEVKLEPTDMTPNSSATSESSSQPLIEFPEETVENASEGETSTTS